MIFTLTDNERYQKALAFAADKHQGQLRKGGEPYIIHPIAVAGIIQAQGYGEDYIITALFHDLLEDTNATEAEILSYGGPAVLNAVKLLTKKDGYIMEEYVSGIRQNPIAFAVKGADRLHNLRSALYTEESFKRHYVLETLEWYMDFHREIPQAVIALAESMESPVVIPYQSVI